MVLMLQDLEAAADQSEEPLMARDQENSPAAENAGC